jgi:hypothetical protein
MGLKRESREIRERTRRRNSVLHGFAGNLIGDDTVTVDSFYNGKAADQAEKPEDLLSNAMNAMPLVDWGFGDK